MSGDHFSFFLVRNVHLFALLICAKVLPLLNLQTGNLKIVLVIHRESIPALIVTIKGIPDILAADTVWISTPKVLMQHLQVS
jgi:hypothetical protein